jgi:hypothetical protein
MHFQRVDIEEQDDHRQGAPWVLSALQTTGTIDSRLPLVIQILLPSRKLMIAVSTFVGTEHGDIAARLRRGEAGFGDDLARGVAGEPLATRLLCAVGHNEVAGAVDAEAAPHAGAGDGLVHFLVQDDVRAESRRHHHRTRSKCRRAVDLLHRPDRSPRRARCRSVPNRENKARFLDGIAPRSLPKGFARFIEDFSSPESQHRTVFGTAH